MDLQRSAVYRAEDRLRKLVAWSGGSSVRIANSVLTLPRELHFGDLDAVRRYVAAHQAQPWYRQAYPATPPLRVEETRAKRHAFYHCGAIFLNDRMLATEQWQMSELVVLHEMAHHVSRDQHGPQFVRALLHHIENAMGAETALVAWITFTEDNVKIGAAA